MKYLNPILPGLYPDPSVCRVGDDFYLVNSSFEYFPGVPIHHSKDMVHWRQIGHCLTRKSQLPLEGTKPSDGIYAPTIRHHAGRFYMVTTNMISGQGFRNFYVHTDDPAGEWSEPVWVDQGGIDPSLLFDDDGKAYFTANGTLWAPVRGAYQSEIDLATGKRLTDVRLLWPGTGGAYPEAPHLFKRGGFYYLMLAEGGTAECHSATIARSDSPWGPFESCPRNPILTSRGLMGEIQATGHADFVEDQAGNWWAVFLGYRYAHEMFHPLGRETYLAPVTWDAEGWPLIHGGKRIQPVMETGTALPAHPWPVESVRDDFGGPALGLCWNHLRNPHEENWSLDKRPGWLRLGCSPVTLDEIDSPAFVGRRQQHFDCRASALLDFEPRAGNEEAGLTVLISNEYHCEIAVSQRAGRRVAVVRRRAGSLVGETVGEPLPHGPVTLFIKAGRQWYELGYLSGGTPMTLATTEVRFLSSEVAGGYTGAYFGMYATARHCESANHADFDWFDYEPLG